MELEDATLPTCRYEQREQITNYLRSVFDMDDKAIEEHIMLVFPDLWLVG